MMAKDDIGKKVIVTPAWLEKYDYFIGRHRGHEGEIIGFQPYSELYDLADETPDDDGQYLVRTANSDLRLRRFDFKFNDD